MLAEFGLTIASSKGQRYWAPSCWTTWSLCKSSFVVGEGVGIGLEFHC